jgi:hypothetical protein
MKNLRFLKSAIGPLLIVLTLAQLGAAEPDNVGVFKATAECDIEIFLEDGNNAGKRIHSQHFKLGDSVNIVSPDGRVVYHTKPPNGMWSSDVHAWCKDHRVITVP